MIYTVRRGWSGLWRGGMIALMLGLQGVVAGSGADRPIIRLELNRMDDVAGACRIALVGQNQTDTPLMQMVLELVLFDTNGTIDRFMRLRLPAMTAGGLRAVQFDISGAPCAHFGRFLINDVVACEGAEIETCRDRLVATSRTDIELLAPVSALLSETQE